MDTSFLIDLMNSQEDALELHEETRSSQATSTVCVYELSKLDGFEPSKLEPNRVLGFTRDDAESAGDVYRRLRDAGDMVGETDCMISGVALAREMELLTRDEDFEKVDGLETIYY